VPSSLQLYGQATVGVTSKSNQTGGETLRELSNSVLAASFFGLRGTEDLGGGMSALFRIESNVAINNGVGGVAVGNSQKFWNRHAFVGLNAHPQVTLTAGRQFLPHAERAIATLDVYYIGGTTLHTTPLGLFGVNRFVGNDNRTDSSLKVRVRGDYGLSAAAGFGLDDGAGRVASFDAAQVRQDYALAVYGARYEAPFEVAGDTPQHTVVGGGGWINWGPTRWFLHVVRSELDSAVAGGLTQENQIVVPAVAWTVTPAVSVKAALYHDKGTNLNGVPGRDGTKLTLVASTEYALSKRTSLYAAAFTNRFEDGYRQELVNIIGLNRDPAASNTQGFSAGMRHDF
jgi:predicted porin